MNEKQKTEKCQQTGCQCGSQFFYDVGTDLQAGSIQHTAGLGGGAESSERGQPDDGGIADKRILKIFFQEKYPVSHFQRRRGEKKKILRYRKHIKEREKDREHDDITSYFHYSLKTVH